MLNDKKKLRLDDICVRGNNKKTDVLRDISLNIRENEIVAIAGVAGNGQRELAEMLNGLRPWHKGTFKFRDEVVSKGDARAFLKMGFGRIPEDRHHTGTVGEMRVWENLLSEKLRQRPFWRFRTLIDFSAHRKKAAELIEQFDIRCNSMETPARL